MHYTDAVACGDTLPGAVVRNYTFHNAVHRMHTSHFHTFQCTLQTLHISHQTFHNAHCFSTFSQHSVQVLTIGVWIGNYRFLCCAATIWKHTQWRKVSTINDSPSAFFRFPAWFWCWCWWSPQYGRVHQISSVEFFSLLDLIKKRRKNFHLPPFLANTWTLVDLHFLTFVSFFSFITTPY